MYILYMHTAPNGKRYIGITSNIDLRWRNKGRAYSEQVFGRAIKKYGWNNITHEIIISNLSFEWACHLEQLYIALYDTMNPLHGYNRTLGGQGSKGMQFSHSDETKARMSQSHKGKIFSDAHKYNLHLAKLNQSKETRQKISESHKRENLSVETRKRLSDAQKGKHLSDDTKEKLRQANLGKKMPDDVKRKISEALKGKPKHKKKRSWSFSKEIQKTLKRNLKNFQNNT